MAIDENTPLTGKQPAFVDQYFIHNFNGKKAAKGAGYKGNDGTLTSIASENLRKPNIQRAIRERMKAMTIQADEVLYRISQHATGSMDDFLSIDEDGNAKTDLKTAAELGKLGLIHELTEIVTTDKDGTKTRKFKIRLYSQKDALSLLARIHGQLGATGTKEDPIHVEIPGLDDALEKIYGRPNDDNDTADNGRSGA